MWIFWRYLVWLCVGSPTVIVMGRWDTEICPVEIIAGVPIIRKGKVGRLLNEDGTMDHGETWRDLIGRVSFG
jgi:hypothetical protein